MKKLLLLIITALMLLFFVACNTTPSNGNNEGKDPTPPDSSENGENTPPNAEPETYLLKTTSKTDEYGNAGTYTEINSKYSAGENIDLVATVNPGYNFVGWFINDVCVSEDLKYTFTMKSSKVEIEARYNYFTVRTFSNSNAYDMAGTYTVLNNKKASVGEEVKLEATVNAGYNFEGWFINNVCVSEDMTYSFVMKENNVILEARWSYYTVSVYSYTDDHGTAGSFTRMDNVKTSSGETVTLNATVADGYNFEGWYIDDVCVGTELTYQFVMGKAHKSIRAEYSCYTLTTNGYMDKSWNEILTENAGTITKYDNKPISNGKKVTLTATLGEGFTFKGWFIAGICVCKDLEYTYTMTKESVVIDALYTYYTVETGAMEFLGEIEPDGRFPGYFDFNEFEDFMGTYTEHHKTLVRVGDTVTLTAAAKAGYEFIGWKRGEVLISTLSTYSFVMEETDEFIEAVFVYTGK